MQGMTVCQTIVNFYPTDGSGAYVAGNFTVNRSTGGYFGGLVIAPTGNINQHITKKKRLTHTYIANIAEGSTGGFAGQVVAVNYYFANGNGVTLSGYNSISGNSCNVFSDGCVYGILLFQLVKLFF
jgi:hypothetical protein